jgi:Ca2+-binding EF-hand superfamily protein
LFSDKDGNGKLDMAEMKAWITPAGFDHAEAEAHHLIHMSDDSKVGHLDTWSPHISVAGQQVDD